MVVTIPAERSVTCVLDRDPANVARARELARQVLGEWHLDGLADVTTLIVSELVTNSLRHGHGPVSVRLSYAGGVLRTEVHDHGTGRPVRRNAGSDDEDGRGLALLSELAGLHDGELGVIEDHGDPGKTVYVNLAAPASAPAAASAPRATAPRPAPGSGRTPKPTPGQALAVLRDKLSANGLVATGMTVTRLSAILILRNLST